MYFRMVTMVAKQRSRNPGITHISLIAEEMEESTEFYENVLGFEVIETPELERQEDYESDETTPFQMLRAGDQLLHLWYDPNREPEATRLAHFGVHVDDFEAVYQEAKERGVFAGLGVESAPPRVFKFNGNAQMYLRDPTGNLVEVDYPDIDELDTETFDEIVERGGDYGDGIGVYAAGTKEQ